MNLGKTLITLEPWLGKDYHREMYIPACVLGTNRLIKVTKLNISSFGPQSVYPETKMKLIDDEIYQE